MTYSAFKGVLLLLPLLATDGLPKALFLLLSRGARNAGRDPCSIVIPGKKILREGQIRGLEARVFLWLSQDDSDLEQITKPLGAFISSFVKGGN